MTMAPLTDTDARERLRTELNTTFFVEAGAGTGKTTALVTRIVELIAAGALQMFLASRLYMYTQVYHHRTGRRFDLSMREIFSDTIALLLPGNPLDNRDDYLRLNDWSVLEAAQRWTRSPLGSEERRLGDAWGRLLGRDLHWHLAYETIAHRGVDLSTLQERLLAAVPDVTARARVQVDVVSAKIAPHNPMADHGFVDMYDPIKGTVERTHTAEMIERLPQHNQLVRVFTDDVEAIPALHRAIRQLLN